MESGEEVELLTFMTFGVDPRCTSLYCWLHELRTRENSFFPLSFSQESCLQKIFWLRDP